MRYAQALAVAVLTVAFLTLTAIAVAQNSGAPRPAHDPDEFLNKLLDIKPEEKTESPRLRKRPDREFDAHRLRELLGRELNAQEREQLQREMEKNRLEAEKGLWSDIRPWIKLWPAFVFIVLTLWSIGSYVRDRVRRHIAQWQEKQADRKDAQLAKAIDELYPESECDSSPPTAPI